MNADVLLLLTEHLLNTIVIHISDKQKTYQ